VGRHPLVEHGLGTDLAQKLNRVVIPVLSGVTLVLVGIATWIGVAVG
jgi:hypothetical protein